MDTTSTDERPTCPTCGHVNIPGAAFCAQCGRSLADGETEDETQVTSTYAPVGATTADRSPWAPPAEGIPPTTDAGQTSALPITSSWTLTNQDATPEPAIPHHEESIRGFVLGAIAAVLILLVVLLYIYTAWLGDSTRDTIDGWLPWL
jgi:hypothetical protein